MFVNLSIFMHAYKEKKRTQNFPLKITGVYFSRWTPAHKIRPLRLMEDINGLQFVCCLIYSSDMHSGLLGCRKQYSDNLDGVCNFDQNLN